MKIEICDNTFYLALWSVIVAGLVTAICFCVAQYSRRTEAAFAAGYSEKQDMAQSTHWEKP